MKPIHWLFLLICCLTPPALLINLGIPAFIDDEAIRSLVALEMKLSGNYITPTLLGEYYYNKPPLFNWLLLLFFTLTGEFSELYARIPTVLALLGYGGTIYYFARKHFDREFAFLSAFLFITCGRILFWDSLLALIDITFSWVTFTSFMLIFHLFERRQFLWLFLLSYTLAALGFLLKGLPAIVFQGTTLLLYFAWQRQIRKLFSGAHFLGIAVFLLILGSYYLSYHQYNSLEQVVPTLFVESSKRTVVNYGMLKTLLHLVTFPFEMTYHFLPWSLLIIYLLHRNVLSWLRDHSFIFFCCLTFCGNIIVYWTSPEVYPRYLLMLAPLLFMIFLFLHRQHEREMTWQFKTLEKLFGGVMILICLASLLPLFLDRTQSTSFLVIKTLSISIGCLAVTFLYYYRKNYRYAYLVLFLLLVRIGFNWFVLPDRNANDFGDLCRITSQRIGSDLKHTPLFVYKETEMQPTNSFYLTNGRQQIVHRKFEDFTERELYIIDPEKYAGLEYEIIAEMKVRHGKLTYHVGRLLNLN